MARYYLERPGYIRNEEDFQPASVISSSNVKSPEGRESSDDNVDTALYIQDDTGDVP